MSRWWSVDDITPEWVTRVFGGRGRAHTIAVTPLMRTPTTAAVQVVVTHGDGDIPASVVVKAAAPDYHGPGESHGREHAVYTHLGGIGMPISTCLAAHLDVDKREFWLVLEDLGPVDFGDDLLEQSFPMVFRAVGALAHVRRAAGAGAPPSGAAPDWLEPSMLPEPRDLGEAYVTFVERYGERIAPRHLMIANRIVGSIDALTERDGILRSRRGIVHGDFRFDNIVLRVRGDTNTVMVTDWSRATWGPAVTDLAVFLATAMPTQTRRRVEDKVFEHYRNALGGPGGEFDQTETELRREVRDRAHAAVVHVLWSSVHQPRTPRRDELWLTLFGRACDYLVDLDAAPAVDPAIPPDVDPVVIPALIDERAHAPADPRSHAEEWTYAVTDPVSRVGLLLRFGVTPDAPDGYLAALVSGPDIPSVALYERGINPTDVFTVDTPTLSMLHEVVTPMRHVRVRLAGTGRIATNTEIASDDKPTATIEFDLNWFSAAAPALYPSTTLYTAPTAVAGYLRAEPDIVAATIDAPGFREHGWSADGWQGMDWVRTTATFDDGVMLNALAVSVPGLSEVTLGTIRTEQPAPSMVAVESSRLLVDDESRGDGRTCVFAVEPGSLTLTFTVAAHVPPAVPGARPEEQIHRMWGTYTRNDGRTGVGWVESTRPILGGSAGRGPSGP